MIHDPLAMTSSVPSAHNIRICIPRIPATVRICPPPENKRSRLYRRPLGFPLGKVPPGKEGVRSAHQEWWHHSGATTVVVPLEAQRKKLSFESEAVERRSGC